MLVFEERGKPEYPEKNLSEQNQQQTQPTYDAGSGNRTRDTLVGGERSHHSAIPAPLPGSSLTTKTPSFNDRNGKISSTFQFLDGKLSDSRINHALIRCVDRIFSTNWDWSWRALFAYKLKLDKICTQVSIKGNTCLFT